MLIPASVVDPSSRKKFDLVTATKRAAIATICYRMLLSFSCLNRPRTRNKFRANTVLMWPGMKMWNLGETTIKYLTEPSESGIADEDRKAVNAMMAPVRYAHPSPERIELIESSPQTAISFRGWQWIYLGFA